VPGKGYQPVSCVHEVPHGSEIERLGQDSIRVTTPKGEVFEYGKCEYEVPKELTVDNGWNVYASWKTNAPRSEVTTFNGNWTIPPQPSNKGDQTLFLFTGLQNMYVGNTEIIQPVLQWGPSAGGGGQYWSVASWYVPTSGHTIISPLTNVNAGDQIFGLMELSASAHWTVSTIVESEGVNTSFTMKTNPIQDWAAVTLEAYGVGPCSQYPGSAVDFTGLYIAIKGSVQTPDWSPTAQFTNCQESVTVNSPTDVTLSWST